MHEEGLNQLFSAYQPNLSGDSTLSCFLMLSPWADLFGFLRVMVLRDCLCVVAVVINMPSDITLELMPVSSRRRHLSGTICRYYSMHVH